MGVLDKERQKNWEFEAIRSIQRLVDELDLDALNEVEAALNKEGLPPLRELTKFDSRFFHGLNSQELREIAKTAREIRIAPPTERSSAIKKFIDLLRSF